MSGYGTSPYGLGVYGYATPPPSLVNNGAWAVGSNTVRVRLSTEPLHANANSENDALNPASWRVRAAYESVYWYIMGVTLVDEYTYDLRVMEPLGTTFDSFTLKGYLKTQTGLPYTVGYLSFDGCQPSNSTTVQKRSSASGFAIQDLQNSVGGTYG